MNRAGIFLIVISVGGCIEPFSAGDKPGTEPGTFGPENAKVGTRALRRLTPREYDNTLRDVFGLDDSWPGAGLAPDASSTLGFDNDAALLEVDDARAEALATVAEAVARLVMPNATAAIPACATPGRACAAAVVDRFGPRLYRRALTDAERGRHLAAYDALAADTAPGEAVVWTLAGVLQSPHVLYRFELGEAAPDGSFRLTGDELASSLSYTFGGGPPSDALLELGRRGELANAAVRLDEARRLLDGPRGQQVIDDFMRRWLRYDDVRTLVKDEAAVQGFAALRGDMAEETRRFVADVFFEKRAGVPALFNSGTTFVSPALAQHYGLPAPAQPFGAAERPPEQALGLLAQGSLLSRFATTHGSSPPLRGAFVWRRLLCRDMSPPPPNAGSPPVPQPGLTTRELFEKVHSTGASCAGCHRKIDPIGFGLEAFDTAGRWRSTEEGKPIAAQGVVVELDASGDAAFADARGLSQTLATSKDVAQCLGGLLSAWAYGATAARSYATPSQTAALAAGTLPLHDFYLELATAPHFAVRAEIK